MFVSIRRLFCNLNIYLTLVCIRVFAFDEDIPITNHAQRNCGIQAIAYNLAVECRLRVVALDNIVAWLETRKKLVGNDVDI